MAAPAIIDGSKHFFPITYEGNGGGQRVGKFLPFTNNGTIAKSCIFDHDSEPELSRTPSSGGNRKTFTVSTWIKLCDEFGQRRMVFSQAQDGSNSFYIEFTASNVIEVFSGVAGADLRLITNRTFEDTSKFYHILVAIDTTQATASNRAKLYVDGDQITSFSTETYPSQDYNTWVNHTVEAAIGNWISTGYATDGYIAEFNLVDGTALTPSTFGLTDTSTGRWIPKSLTGITYGTNGLRLEFANSAGQTIGDDTSGNGNDLAVSNLATTDLTTDSPTQNFITFDPNRYLTTQQKVEEGGLTVYASSGSGYTAMAANKEIPQSGKWYWEVKLEAVGSVQGITNPAYGVIDRNIKEISGLSNSNEFSLQLGGMGATLWSGFKFGGLFSTAVDFTIGSYAAATNDYVVFAFDMDDGKAWWGFKDGSADLVWYANDGGSDGNPSTGANPTVTFNPKHHRFVPVQQFYAPGSGYSARYHYNFGQKAYAFTAPTGFSGLSQNNFPDDGKGIPDVVWIKNRDQADAHQWYDSTRGPLLDLQTDSTNTEGTTTDGLQKFIQDGFAIEDDVSVNSVNESFVGWNWVAGGGTTSANSDGSGASLASTIQKNETAGFSIVSYSGSGTGSSVAGTVAHGLSQTPECIWIKSRTAGNNWVVYHHKISDPSDKVLYLNDTNAETNWPYMGDTDPTNKVFTISSDLETGRASNTYMAYCWYGIEGFSKFGTYEGNNSADGTFVYLGFKPALLIVKNLDGAYGWRMYDNARAPINPIHNTILADVTTAENTSTYEADFLANGFKQRDTYSSTNASNSYVYMAWAEHPFVGSGTNPVTAR